MEKDHAELIQLIAKSQRAAEAEGAQKEQRIAELERKYRELERQIAQIQVGALAPPAPVAAHIPAPQPVVQQQVESPPPPAAPETIQSRYADLFGLYNQGKSIEMISKKLGMNKGEVQLVLQLAKQEAAANG
jgi:DNA-binding NarL/FixJ family response regulator